MLASIEAERREGLGGFGGIGDADGALSEEVVALGIGEELEGSCSVPSVVRS